MISQGHHLISKHLRLRVEAQADESFCARAPVELSDLPIPPEGWVYALETAVALKIKGYCAPHTDDFSGNGDNEHTQQSSLFWLLKDTSPRPSHLMVEGESRQMSPGDWALFDDSKLHAFLASGTWIGLAVQLHPQYLIQDF